MYSQDSPLQQLQEIRRMMERSSRFIGLSGLSGVSAGVCALAGAGVAYVYLPDPTGQGWALPGGLGLLQLLLFDAGIVLVAALAGAIYFTTRRARRQGQPIWDALTRRLLANLLVPLAAGGIFCLALLWHGLYGLVAPATLVFYGLALLNASKYTLPEIWYLGLSEMALGLLGMFWVGLGLELWAAGFGLLHIGYGLLMYQRYERTDPQMPPA